MEDEEELPVLTAVSSSARQLYQLLRCINFSEKAHVTINETGLKFSVDDASVMEGYAFLDKSLFTTYTFRPPPLPPHDSQHSLDEDGEESNPALPSSPAFQISLPSLLETLQILGLTDPAQSKPYWARDNPSSTAFSNNVLGMNNMCRISYMGIGSPLSIILTESTIRTTCNLTTYEPDFADEIPFDRQSLAFKTIMRGTWLSDAVSELASTTPERIALVAKNRGGKPFFALAASGHLGSARVEFNNNPKPTHRLPTPATVSQRFSDADTQSTPSNLLETFQLSDPDVPLKCAYKFAFIQKAVRAMSIATKVSIRADTQGVLSLQFMIEVEPGKLSFVDFRFVPLVEEGEGEDTYLEDGEVDAGSEGEGEGSQDCGGGVDDEEMIMK